MYTSRTCDGSSMRRSDDSGVEGELVEELEKKETTDRRIQARNGARGRALEYGDDLRVLTAQSSMESCHVC